MDGQSNLAMTLGIGCLIILLATMLFGVSSASAQVDAQPLSQHPRPDFQRERWINLNGAWSFRFDAGDQGANEKWFDQSPDAFDRRIVVPFPWGSKLSGIPKSEADLAWYARSITIPSDWNGQRVYLILGACDWQTSAWLDGKKVGEFQGGYTPATFDLTDAIKPGTAQTLVLRVDDRPHKFKLEGKQGYGPARGIWQTAYLEARPKTFIRSIQFLPDIDAQKVTVRAQLNQAAAGATTLAIAFRSAQVPQVQHPVPAKETSVTFDIPLPDARLWSLEDPFLYDVDAVLKSPDAEDRVSTYFGMRKISVVNLPGTEHPYIALNDRPVYLQIALDQSYHPEGFYAYPSDDFMRDEILRARRIGLNALRLHVKIDVPRKIYWADRLGILIMADVPNSWGEPTPEMQNEADVALRGMLERDFNHPSIFSWVIFNETWGLQDKDKKYQPETQKWVASMYELTKKLDPTRLVEDNSPCNLDHVATDINSWHTYRPGYTWREHLEQVTRDTHEGSTWNYAKGYTQAKQPLLNSECGNVWGYEGSTGDVDWSWDYHIMLNEFRRHPKVCGWLYTEHHDVINEWNGYYRYDRSEKETGLGDVMPGMTLNDLHAPFYISVGDQLCADAKPSETISVPLWASFMTDRAASSNLVLKTELFGWDRLGQRHSYSTSNRTLAFEPWMSKAIDPISVTMPAKPGLAVLGITLEDQSGIALQRNFTTFVVSNGSPSPRDESIGKMRHLRFAPEKFSQAKWSMKQWNILDGKKVNGAGSGYFEYRIPWPTDLKADQIQSATFRMEASAKQLFGKDKDPSAQRGDAMRGQGSPDPSKNPNAYPMTDETRFPSAVQIRIAGESQAIVDLPDDPADHRGILSWHAQPRDNKLREAGSYGYLVTCTLSPTALQKSALAGEIVIRLEVDDSLPGGLAIYGESFGRYPLDPTMSFMLK